MTREVSKGDDDDAEYFVLPEEAFVHLPDDMRNQLEKMAEDGRAVLRSVDQELNQAGRLSRSMIDLVSLRHVQDRLSTYRFSADMSALLELDMLITAFVVTYARLQKGGAGWGFKREDLPNELRIKHDEIIDLRNKRFAHSDDHHSITNMMEIQFAEEAYEIHPSLNMRIQIGGAPEWKELVEAVEGIVHSRLDKLVGHLSKKTGYKWVYAKGPAPDESGQAVG